MICNACGTENETGRKFCAECGQRLASTCPSCGAANAPAAKFCGECGSQFSAGPVAAAPSPAETSTVPSAERRLVSVLFADLVGFTTLSEARDPEDVRELLNGYFDTCRAIVDRYGGTIEKFIGDAVMAVWGTPVAQEDDAERAVRAALELVDAVNRLGESAAIPGLALRAGVHTGEAVVTLGASGMGMVAGDVVNTASRLQSVAPPGCVLVGEGTWRAASDAIVFEPAGEQQLKGKSSPVPAFIAQRVVAKRGGAGRAEQFEPPFVGRDSELRLIKDFYHATARERGPRVVSVIGQAGIGKSRLAWEFLKYLDGLAQTVYWHQGRSPSYGEGISFWALGEMVRMRAGIGEGADEATTRERLAATLAEFVPDPDERHSLEGPLLHLLGIGDGQGRDRGQLFVAWRTFFERIADVAPVVLVFEDLQWADDGLLDFIEEMATWSRGRSLYLITLARPELLDRRSTWGAGQRSFTSLSLSPLDDEQVTSLLAGMVPGLPPRVVRQIVQRAEGIPLYAVETVRMLLNEGRIERNGETFRPVGELDELAVPESLHALIAARIDGLGPMERTLIQDASVLGLSFALPALTAVSRVPADEIEPMLRHLAQRELLALDDDPRSPEHGQFHFVQGLLREVAYGTLSRDDRRARHVAAARYFEALGDDELAGVLAQHYLDAYRAHPDAPGGTAVAAQARVALRAAAQRSANLGSHRTAHGYLQSALEIATDAAEELELQRAATDTAAAAGMFAAAIDHGERAIALATQLGDDYARRTLIAALGTILLEGQHTRARQLLIDAMDEPGLQPSEPGYFDLAEALAKAEMRTQHDARAIEIADQALPAEQSADDDRLLIELLITRGTSLANVGRQTEALISLTGALDVARRRGYAAAAGRAALNLGYVLEADDPARGYAISRESLAEGLQSGAPVWMIRYRLGNALDGAISVGDWEWAEQTLVEHADLAVEPAERLWFGAFRNVIRAYRGEPVDDEVERLYEESQTYDDSQWQSLGGYPIIVLRAMRGDLSAAIELTDDVLRRTQQAGIIFAPFGARAATWLGDIRTLRRLRETYRTARIGRLTQAQGVVMDAAIATLEGDRALARNLYLDAQRRLRELGVRVSLGLCLLDIVETGAMQPDERQRAADEARQIFTKLGARPLLDRLDAALARQVERIAADQPLREVETTVQPA